MTFEAPRYGVSPEEIAENERLWAGERVSSLSNRRIETARKLILTDIDDTVLQYTQPFEDWCRYSGYALRGPLQEMGSVEAMLGVEFPQAVAIMKEFIKDGGLVHQPPEDDALDALPRLYRAGYRFVGITACGLCPAFQRARKALLEATFDFPWEALHVVDLGASKRPLLNAYAGAVWVEDNFGHAAAGAEHGHRSFLINRSHNLTLGESEGVTRVDGWLDIERALKGAVR